MSPLLCPFTSLMECLHPVLGTEGSRGFSSPLRRACALRAMHSDSPGREHTGPFSMFICNHIVFHLHFCVCFTVHISLFP